MEREYAIELLTAWDRVNNAAQRMIVAQPCAMTEAAERLDSARLSMQAILNRLPAKAASDA